jgi:hypothetical protein
MSRQTDKIEEDIRDILRDILLLDASESQQSDAKQDLVDALVDIQSSELMALRRAYE